MSITSTAPAALMAELVALREERDRLLHALARKRGERLILRRERTIERARLDAMGLLTIAAGGGSIERKHSPLPQRRWAYAVALLKLAGIARGTGVRLRLADPSVLMVALDRATDVAKENPYRFARFIPPSITPEFLSGKPTQPTRSRKPKTEVTPGDSAA